MLHLLEQRLLFKGYPFKAAHVLFTDVFSRALVDLRKFGVAHVCHRRLLVDKAAKLELDDVVDLSLRKRLYHD